MGYYGRFSPTNPFANRESRLFGRQEDASPPSLGASFIIASSNNAGSRKWTWNNLYSCLVNLVSVISIDESHQINRWKELYEGYQS